MCARVYRNERTDHDISQFLYRRLSDSAIFHDLSAISLGMPSKEIHEFTCFYSDGHGQIFRAMKLFPLPLSNKPLDLMF